MIKGNELRIGNTILVKGFPVEVTEYTFQNLKDGKVVDGEPIPLTEEWLIKFGCDLGLDKTSYFIGDLELFMDDKNNTLTVNSDSAHYTLTILKYVHQLQNLYFALTGEELTIKESCMQCENPNLKGVHTCEDKPTIKE